MQRSRAATRAQRPAGSGRGGPQHRRGSSGSLRGGGCSRAARTRGQEERGERIPQGKGSGRPARRGLHHGGTRACGRDHPADPSRCLCLCTAPSRGRWRRRSPRRPLLPPARGPAVQERRSTCSGAEPSPPATFRCALGLCSAAPPCHLARRATCRRGSDTLSRGPARAERWHGQTGDGQRVRTDLLSSRAFSALPWRTGKGAGQPRSQAASAGRPHHRALAVGHQPSNPVAVGGVPVPPHYRDLSFGARFRRGNRNETKMSLSPMAGGARLCPQHFEGRALAPADSAGGSTAPAIILSQPQAAAFPQQPKPKTAAARRGARRLLGHNALAPREPALRPLSSAGCLQPLRHPRGSSVLCQWNKENNKNKRNKPKASLRRPSSDQRVSGQQYLCRPALPSFPPVVLLMSSLLLTLVYTEKELRTIEKQSLQPDVYREGTDSAGAE